MTNLKPVVAVIAVAVLGLATALGIDLPAHEIAGAVTDLVVTVAGMIGILVNAWRGSSRDPGGPVERPEA